MKTDFETVLAILRKNKEKKMQEGFTTADFGEAIGVSQVHARKVLGQLIKEGLAAFVGKVNQASMCGSLYPVPIYKLTPKK